MAKLNAPSWSVLENTPLDRVLLKELRRGNVAFLVGAGVSRPPPSNLPLGGDLVNLMVDALTRRAEISNPRRASVINLISSRLRPEVIFDVLFAEIGTICFRVLRCLGQGEPNYIHYFLAAMLRRGNDVLTTNYDVQIERASADSGLVIQRAISRGAFRKAAKRSSNNVGVLYKLHGSLKLNGNLPDRTSLIAAMRQVGRGLDEAKAQVLERVLQAKPLVVLGYSGRDEFDIVPKLTATPKVKYVHWILHSDLKNPRSLNWSVAKQSNLPVVRLLNSLNGPSRLISCDTQDFVRLLWRKVSTAKPFQARPLVTGVNLRGERLWAELSQPTAVMLVGDLLRSANAPRSAGGLYSQVPKRKGDNALTAKILLKRAQAALDLGDINEAVPLIEKSLPVAWSVKDHTSIVLAYNYLGIISRKRSQWDLALSYYRRALTMARRYGEDLQMVEDLYNNLGIVLEKKKSYRLALRYLKMGLDLARQSGNPQSAAQSLNNLGIAYDNLRKFDDAIASYLESLRLKELIGYRHGIAQTTHNLGLVFEHAGKQDLALYWYAKSLGLKKGLTHDKHGIAQTQSNLGRLFRQQGKVRKARKLLQRAVRVLRHVGDDFGLGEAAEELARLENEARRYSEARTAANDALQIYRKLRLSNDAARCRNLLRKIPPAQDIHI
jgi:tetratricopeptide (TPR) repeat protein